MKLKHPVTRHVTDLLSDALFLRLYFAYKRRQILHLADPKTFSEKIQWLKLYGKLEDYSQYVDKYDVRPFIEKELGERYLIPLIGMWQDAEDIPFETLPDRFVLKGTHGSGYNFVCKDKSKIDVAALKKTITSWTEENFYITTRETQYKKCTPKIVVEQYLEDESGALRDYKFFCFDGQPTLIEVISDRFEGRRIDFFDLEWNHLDIERDHPRSEIAPTKPANLTDMIKAATTLSAHFPFVRADFYSVDGKTYFGELTFTPGSGLGEFKPAKTDDDLGAMLNLKPFRERKGEPK
jgi:hypothetical protein